MTAATNASAQLMQLRDSESVRIHDHHHGGVGNVDPDLHDRGRDEYVDLAVREGQHDLVFLDGTQSPVQHAKPQPGQRPVLELGRDIGYRESWAARLLGLAEVPEVEAAVFGKPESVVFGESSCAVAGPRARSTPSLSVGSSVGVTDNPRAYDIGLTAGRDLLVHPLPGAIEVVRLLRGRHDVSGDSRPARGQLGQLGDLEIAEYSHRNRSRYR